MKQKELLPIQLFPMGDKALVLHFEEEVSEDNHRKIQAVAHYLDQHPLQGVVEYVPAYTTLTLYYDPWVLSDHGKTDPYDNLVSYLQQALSHAKEQKPANTNLIDIPVCYGGDYGPDLEEVAAYHQLTTAEVIARHSQPTYLVHMMGFAPGFPYLGGLDKRIATPRKATPQTAIPVGAVGIAGEQTGIYPIATPGGWQLIGRTPLILFDPNRTPASLLKAGDKVRFIPISASEFKEQAVRHEH